MNSLEIVFARSKAGAYRLSFKVNIARAVAIAVIYAALQTSHPIVAAYEKLQSHRTLRHHAAHKVSKHSLRQHRVR